MSGEMLLSIGCGLSMFLVGALAHWQVRKAYSQATAEKSTIPVFRGLGGEDSA